ncbi:tyrosine-type recombinase/integrase [Nostoc sp. WHI]|uniref:tyrosine-type recombinase/integrase n=1 Tax=Nostoc sp. WHI TaxID=2650611 RepID=UPI002ED8ED99
MGNSPTVSVSRWLPNQGYSTREIQDFLGHRDIKHTEKYTKLNARRFLNFDWGDLVDGFIRSQTYYKVEFILGDELEYIRHSKHDINTEYRYFKSCKFKVNNEFNTYFNILIYA